MHKQKMHQIILKEKTKGTHNIICKCIEVENIEHNKNNNNDNNNNNTKPRNL